MSLQTFRASIRLLFAAALFSQASAQDLPPRSPESIIPFELASDFVIVVPGQVGELRGLKFILDTGSSFSAIDRRVADKFGLPRRSGKVANFDRNLAIEWVDVPEVCVGPLRVARMSLIVAKLADLSEFAEGVDGIIGLDVLSRAEKISIDYERRIISVEVAEHHPTEPPATNAFVLPVVVQGLPLRLLVDTGLRDILLYKDPLRSGLPHLRIAGNAKPAVIGRLQATRVNLPGVGIFGRDALTPVFLIDGPKTAAIGDVDGYLGPASLHAKRFELDFAAKVIRWQ